MPVSSIVKTKRDGTISIGESGAFDASDGSDVAMKSILTIECEVGDWSISVAGESVSAFLDRGSFGSSPKLRAGDDQAITGSFSLHFRGFGDSGAAEATQTFLRTASSDIVANWASTNGGPDVYTYMLRYAIDDGTDTMRLILDHVHITGEISEGDPTTVNCSFTAYQARPSLVYKAP
jgi:hypothetical protein